MATTKKAYQARYNKVLALIEAHPEKWDQSTGLTSRRGGAVCFLALAGQMAKSNEDDYLPDVGARWLGFAHAHDGAASKLYGASNDLAFFRAFQRERL